VKRVVPLWFPLWFTSAVKGDVKGLQGLLEAGFPLDWQTEAARDYADKWRIPVGENFDYLGNANALILAAEFGNQDVVELLIQAKCALEKKTIFGESALFRAAVPPSHPKIVRALIAAGADVNTCSENGTIFDQTSLILELIVPFNELPSMAWGDPEEDAKDRDEALSDLILNGADMLREIPRDTTLQYDPNPSALEYAFKLGGDRWSRVKDAIEERNEVYTIVITECCEFPSTVVAVVIECLCPLKLTEGFDAEDDYNAIDLDEESDDNVMDEDIIDQDIIDDDVIDEDIIDQDIKDEDIIQDDDEEQGDE